jgi:hypothetical protein
MMGALENALREEETKESLIKLYGDALAQISMREALLAERKAHIERLQQEADALGVLVDRMGRHDDVLLRVLHDALPGHTFASIRELAVIAVKISDEKAADLKSDGEVD